MLKNYKAELPPQWMNSTIQGASEGAERLWAVLSRTRGFCKNSSKLLSGHRNCGYCSQPISILALPLCLGWEAQKPTTAP